MITFIWLTMGPYHIARMNALAKVIGKDKFHVIEICSKDDHNWSLNNLKKEFNHSICSTNALNKKSINENKLVLESYLLNLKPTVIVNGCGYFDLLLNSILKKYKKRFSNKLILWSESTLLDNYDNLFKRLIKKYITSNYDGAIVAGEAHKNMLLKIGFKDKVIKIVGNVVDNQLYQELKLSLKPADFLFVGRFLTIKNISTLLKAFSKLEKEGINWKLTLVGDGPVYDEVKNQIHHLNLSNKVVLTGSLQQEELLKIYSSHAVFVLPSQSEPWGLVVNEAMASGLPVILSNKAGSSEMVINGENGFLFDPNSVEDLYQKMKILYESEELRSQFREKSFRVLENYTLEKYAQRFYEFYESL